MEFGVCVKIQKGSDMAATNKKDRRALEERIDRRLKEVRELLRQNEVVFDRWRAEGILPSEEPRRRF
jgi:hypothetical protein